ncbi:MAG: asparagine synthase (glutamine-hydrolyzing) [Oscillatoria sp. PMC 1068.18]|nr:asparagine synthase (glutamine-hydrolyzing) [Oscillatoria sp. PMC 1076.18]MEC4990869.1 asparagine synthase (glutamine-hydrolyzing) [Oscillatoria sp. PMC 1068.18]
MCGISGFWDREGKLANSCNREDFEAIALRMADSLRLRGPDDRGVWVDDSAGLALSHRRLAIVDLSPLGHQPMVSSCDRYTIVFNGEIYNFLPLRAELVQLGHTFRGHSDTEVMLAAFAEWGVTEAVSKFQGMFAFALWDRQERLLHLGRDRLGIKPLYYGWINSTFVFASELKPFQTFPGFEAKINREALALYLRYNYVPTPFSIYENIYKLPTASLLTINQKCAAKSPICYWDLKAVAEAGVSQPFAGADADAIAELDNLLRDAVKLRMVADVPLGAFLSGGVDSSTVVAFMQQMSSQPVKTFSIGFAENNYNEAEYAQAVAKHLATDHTELYVTAKDAIAVLPQLPSLYDEPFADDSQISTFLVSQLARKQVTVSLSGDGGDELFYGYDRYFKAQKRWMAIAWLPYPLRKSLSQFLTATVPKKSLGYKLHTLSDLIATTNRETLYKYRVSYWKNPTNLVINSTEPTTIFDRNQLWFKQLTFPQQMMYFDQQTYLPDDILTKVDRASMGVSLEARVPLLDHRLVEFTWQLPQNLKFRAGKSKWLLRQVLSQYVPPNLIERPKKGFGIPIHNWLRGSFRDWAESLLDEKLLIDQGFFHPQPIRQKWQEHLTGEKNWGYDLWSILIFQSWLSQQ